MGVISKQVHKRTTNRIVAPVRGVTKLDPDQVIEIIRAVVFASKPRANILSGPSKLWIGGVAPGPYSIYYGPASRKDPSKVVATWSAQVTIRQGSTGTETMLTLQLTRWKTRDGKLVERSVFENFRDNVTANVRAQDTSYSLLEG